ncbi:hypothetical protein [Arenibacter certesii]|uniref:hypothetical protein n=1 Tax=Arenibacter certesii TaxID=228955 RepID=UPI0004189E89|nr:hypothetical protein [Arenibacter certesii]
MNYRIKSLFYLIGFVASALICNHLQEESTTEKEALTIESNEKVNNSIASLE